MQLGAFVSNMEPFVATTPVKTVEYSNRPVGHSKLLPIALRRKDERLLAKGQETGRGLRHSADRKKPAERQSPRQDHGSVHSRCLVFDGQPRLFNIFHATPAFLSARTSPRYPRLQQRRRAGDPILQKKRIVPHVLDEGRRRGGSASPIFPEEGSKPDPWTRDPEGVTRLPRDR